MVVVSYSGKEINAKLVYYGAGLSGKTTNLESIYEAVPDNSRGKMVSMKTQSDRTLFFDLLPLDLGEIMGFKTRFLLYTVPGQVFYNATRKLVLKGADAIVFVADSEVGKMEENKESLANLKANLSEYGLNLETLPWVIQYNKRDLPNVYTVEELNAELNPGGKVPFFEAVATKGTGVFETFRGISHLVMEKVTKDLRRSPGTTAPRPPEEPPRPATPAPPAAPPTLAGRGTPAAPEPAVANGTERVDYGREIELPNPAHAAPRVTTPVGTLASAVQSVTAPPARTAQAPAPAPPRPAPAQSAPAAAPPAPAAVTSSTPPMPSLQAAPATPAPAAAAAPPAEAVQPVVVPVRISRGSAREIVLRIVLQIED